MSENVTLPTVEFIQRRALAPANTGALRLGRWLCGGMLALCAVAAHAFDFDTVAARARQLAASPYKAPAQNLPRELRELPYERYARSNTSLSVISGAMPSCRSSSPSFMKAWCSTSRCASMKW